MQEQLNKKAKEYLENIYNEYSKYMNMEQLEFFNKLYNSDVVIVENNHEAYIQNQIDSINNDSTLNNEEKAEYLNNLTVPIAHGGRVFNDNKIHFYPDTIKNELSEKTKICEAILVHELFHFFIRPEYMDISNNYNSYITEGLVDMCTRDFFQKYEPNQKYNSNYGNNVIYIREALSSLSTKDSVLETVFQCDIKDIVEKTGLDKLIESKNKTTNYDHFIKNVSSLFGGGYHTLMDLSANEASKDIAIQKIIQATSSRSPSVMNQLESMIEVYYQNETNTKNNDIETKKIM